MMTIGTRIKVTREYWDALVDNPNSNREEAVRDALASVGGNLIYFGFMFGNYDVIVLAEVTSESDFIAVLGNAFMKGMIADSNTFTCVNQDTIIEGFNKMKQVDYAVPGSNVEMA